MFLIERLVSLSVFAFALLVACYFVGKLSGRQYKIILTVYLLVLCAFAFYYKPYYTADLYRLRQYISYWIYKPWDSIFSYAVKAGSPAWVLYSYLLNKLGNTNWLQTVSCLWSFGNIFYIIEKETERCSIKGTNRSLLLFFVMAVGTLFLQTISGIRTMLSMSIVAFCLYRDIVEKKRSWIHLFLYLFAMLFHSSVIILVITRFLFSVTQYKTTSRKVGAAIAVLGVGAAMYFFLGDYISDGFEHGQNYLKNEQEYSYIWEILIGLIEAAETFWILRYFKKHLSGDEELRNYDTVRKLCLLWTVICVAALPFSYAIFRRYTIFCSIICLPILAKVLEYEQTHKVNQSKLIRWLWVISLGIFMLSGVRGDLCGYKFFVLQ